MNFKNNTNPRKMQICSRSIFSQTKTNGHGKEFPSTFHSTRIQTPAFKLQVYILFYLCVSDSKYLI